MLVEMLFIGVALLLICGLVALEVALLDARRAFIPKSGAHQTEAARPEASGDESCVSVADFVIGSRLVTVSLAVVTGAVAVDIFSRGVISQNAEISLVEPSFDPVALLFYMVAAISLVVCVITFGYVLPHFVGTRFRDSVIRLLSPFGRLIVRLVWPVIAMAKVVKQLGTRKEGSHAIEEEAIEEDIRSLVEEGERAGVIEEEEREMISRVFRLGDKPVASLMTPRGDVIFLDLGMTVAQAIRAALESRLSWFPVRQAVDDEVVGIVSVHDVFELQAASSADTIAPLKEISLPAMDVPESLTALELLERFKELGEHFAVVRDEYGGVSGIATVDDVLQVVVGDMDEANGAERSVAVRDDGSLLVDASLDVQDLFERLGFSVSEDGDHGRFHSVGGFVMTSLGHIPKAGDSFMQDGYRFEVVDMDGKRIDKVLVMRVANQRAVGT